MANGQAEMHPKALRYSEQLNKAEAMIAEAMPEIMAKLVSMAREGNTAAARYLVDRMYGRPARLRTPVVEDRTPPYTEADWNRERREQRQLKSAIAQNVRMTREFTDELRAMRPKSTEEQFPEKVMLFIREIVKAQREAGMDVPDPVPWDLRGRLMEKYSLPQWDPSKVPIEEIPVECRPRWPGDAVVPKTRLGNHAPE